MGPRRDVLIRKAQMSSSEEFDRGLEVGRDHSGRHVYSTSPRRLETGERGVQGGALLLEVCYSSPQGFLWAQQRVYCGPMAYFFTPHTIFLCGEDKHHKCGDGKFIICGSGGIKYRVADTEGYI